MSLVKFFSKPDNPSLAPKLTVPLWRSILIDWAIVLTCGLYRPTGTKKLKISLDIQSHLW